MVTSILTRPTLVLNRNWQPVAVATVARSLTLVANRRARIIDPQDFQLHTSADWMKFVPADDEPFVQGVTFRLRVPEVITLMEYSRVPHKVVAFTRHNLYQRDRLTCQYCGLQPGSEELTVDHVLPRSRGGTSSWDNCVLACVECNHRKADRTPEEAGMPLRKAPARPAWTEFHARQFSRVKSWSRFLAESYWSVELDA